ncbi:response regulator transcription factor [Phytohabitans flavus]|uniref:Transcriptional regulator n=1 Tax=Phytohabitans flavus TaxID=1076124 RepID=A0A6F8XSK6_9ACTN|nr:response regulator transcription factor [Phytohabitans flavus]BCB76800.1 transcriptional regulator [Phytohabitans flavus]
MEILVLTAEPGSAPAGRVLPALDLLPHSVRVAGHHRSALASGSDPDVVLVDARQSLAEARDACRTLRTSGLRAPLLAVVQEAGLVAVSADWGLDDVVLATAGPAEVEARLRLLATRTTGVAGSASGSLISSGELSIDPETYAAKLKGRPLDLTFKEFELLKFLAQHPGRVFTRDQLLREVWGYDYFGGHRTVDVHVRRLRAKLGSEYESMIGTVRQVGYKLVLPRRAEAQELIEDLETLLA